MRRNREMARIVMSVVAGSALASFSFGFSHPQEPTGSAGQPSPPAAQALSFEVASIKPSEGDGHMVRIQMAPGGRYIAEGVTLKMLIQQAYDVKDFQITGGPAWMSSAAFDINAKAEDSNVTRDQVKQMLQSMLAERFKLKLHRETKDLPIYALLVGKNGPKLKWSEFQPGSEAPPAEASKDGPKVAVVPPGAVVKGAGTGGSGGASAGGAYGVAGKPGGQMMMMGRGMINAQGVPLSGFVNSLAQQLGRPVIDKTELKGNYDIKLEWAPDEAARGMTVAHAGEAPPAGDSSGPSIFTAIQEQLGLRLESQKGPVEALVIDAAEKPSGN